MTIPIEYILLTGAVLILFSVVIVRLTDNLGVPTLLLFLGIGMLAGSEGPGGIYFDDAQLAQTIGIIALIFILFAGGMDTSWDAVRPVLRHAALLAIPGVLLTALFVGVFISMVFNLPILSALLIGAIVSSTDAAAVFAVLRAKGVHIRPPIRHLLELESGSNDPMAVFLTIGLVQLMTDPGRDALSLASLFVVQMGIGGAAGYGLGKGMIFLHNRMKLFYEGLYPVFAIASVVFIYAVTALLGGSGFLAVYIAGLIAGNSDFIQKKSLLRFFDGLAWLSQIAMFLTLGLLVFPSHILPVMGIGLVASAFLMFAARPLSVFMTLVFSGFRWRDKMFISWVGLRGAVPVILATFPLLAGLRDAGLIFNVVFFIVLTSALLQGWSLPWAARLFRQEVPPEPTRRFPIESVPLEGASAELVDLFVPYQSAAAGTAIVDLGLPRDCLIALINRDEMFFVPRGSTVLLGGDTVLVLADKVKLPLVRAILEKKKKPPGA